MSLYKCKVCGGNLEITEGSTIAECEYCGTQQTIPRTGDESVANLFNRANRLRMHCEFDKAEQVYEKIINLDDTESEAHWGMVLCKYGIEYVEDPQTLEHVPTCHRTSYEAVTEDNDYLAAIEHADIVRKELYVKEAKRIEELQKDVLQIVKDEKPFDVFICYKESDENGERTPDSVLAEDIYEALTDKGYRVFFSRITLEDKLGREYEPYIFAALNSAKVMLVVGTKPAYMEAVWVRNEWSRYLKIMKKDSTKLLIPCYRDMDPYDMPEAFSHLQSQNMQKLGAIQDLVRGIGKIIKADNSDDAAKAYMAASSNSALIDNAMSYLKDGNFAIAATTCKQVLKADAQNSMAYVGLLMAELKIKEFTAKKFNKTKYKKNENYQKAVEFADDYIKEKFAGFDAIVAKKKKTAKKIILTTVATIVSLTLIFFTSLEIIYSTAIKKLEKFDSTTNTSLIETFESIDFYKDSKLYIDMINEGVYCDTTNKQDVKKILIFSDDYIVTKYKFPNVEEVVISQGVKEISNKAFFDLNKLKNITISDSVTSIGTCAFYGCTSLTSITIPDSVKTIGEETFQGCTSLTSITIPDSVTSIGGYAFYGCTSLTSIIIPDSVRSIRNYTFAFCNSLTSITLPDSVELIGASAFDSCKSLTTINYKGTVDQWNVIVKARYWDAATGNYVIQCTDGTINK